MRYKDGTVVGENTDDIYQFDPGVLYDEDGRIWLYSGFGPRVSPEAKKYFGEHRTDGAIDFKSFLLFTDTSTDELF